MLVKYREELTRPLQEATEFMRRIETQLNMLSTGPLRIFSSGTFIFSLYIYLYIYIYVNLERKIEVKRDKRYRSKSS